MFSGFFGRAAPPPLDEPSAIGAREALAEMERELISYDRTLGKQFGVFKSSVKELTDKVRQDKATFNASRAQKMPSDTLSVPLEKEALGVDSGAIVGSGMYYGRKVGRTTMKKKHNEMFEFANKHGISKWV